MALTDEQQALFFEKVLVERDRIARRIADGSIAVDVATKHLRNIQQFAPLTPKIIYTTSQPEGIIPAGAYHASFKILSLGGKILGEDLRNDLDVVEFPYIGVPWGDIDYDGDFMILTGR